MRFPLISVLALSTVTTVTARRQFAVLDKISADYTHSHETARLAASLKTRGVSDPLTAATTYLKELAPDAQFRVNEGHYTDKDTGITHVYFTQTVNGLDVENAQANINVKKDGTILSSGSSFLKGNPRGPAPVKRQELLSPLDALKGTIETLKLDLKVEKAQAAEKSSLTGTRAGQSFVIIGAEGALSEPKADLAYYRTPEGLKLIWKLETDLGENWMITYANAQEKGKILGVADYAADAEYRVYKMGVDNPTEGERTLETDPANLKASPNGWHDTTIIKYNDTRGNNGIAQENWESRFVGNFLDNKRAEGGGSLKFDYPYKGDQETDPKNYIDAAVTQIFYISNTYHDLLKVFGFTEEAGNFEEVNSGPGGLGKDAVQLNVQDGDGFNNANFITPPDGQRPRMTMYLWVAPDTKIERDGAFENGIMLHEYTHGLSNRLTGGPSKTTCLNSVEAKAMGEGWSDFYPTAIRIKSNDTRAKDYGFAEWASRKENGIRGQLYSTNMTTNPTIYSSLNDPAYNKNLHSIGTIWAEILYEILWNLIDKHGYEAEIFPKFRPGTSIPTGGRQLAMKLVMDGMKLQPCLPSFLTARDAIIDADVALTNGENLCALWAGFVKRGLGADAKEGPDEERGMKKKVDGFKLPDNFNCSREVYI